MIKVTAKELYTKLVDEYKLIGQKGIISFKLNALTVQVTSNDSVGNMIQEWLKEWMKKEGIIFESSSHSQKFPDIYLNLPNVKDGLLEIKAFNHKRSPGFDLANFDTYGKSLLEHSYHLDCDYLILGYTMSEQEITIKNIWLKKIWEIAGASGPYPLKVQEKNGVIHKIRPVVWYSKQSKYKAFNNKEEFLSALNETRYQYGTTRVSNAHWLTNVIENYRVHTGISLNVVSHK
jgi:hypothetical protein